MYDRYVLKFLTTILITASAPGLNHVDKCEDNQWINPGAVVVECGDLVNISPRDFLPLMPEGTAWAIYVDSEGMPAGTDAPAVAARLASLCGNRVIAIIVGKEVP